MINGIWVCVFAMVNLGLGETNSNSDSWRAPPSTLEIASNASIASTASKKDKGPRPNDPSLKQSHCF